MHSILSPSKAQRWVNCPGSVQEESKFPETSNVYAEEGKLAHEYCYRVLSGLETDYLNVSDSMKENCASYIKRIQNFPEHCTKLFEQRLSMFSINKKMFGTADAIIYDSIERTLYVIDLKYGFEQIDAKNNYQLLSYASAAYDVFRDKGVLKIHLIIEQPRGHKKINSDNEWIISVNELNLHVEELKNSADLALSSKSIFKSGDHCKYCKARSGCSEFSKSAILAAGKTPNFDSLSSELKYLKSKQKLIDLRIKTLNETLIGKILGGAEVPFYRLKKSESRRKWIFDSEEIINIGADNGVDLTTVVSPAEAEKLGLNFSVIAEFSEKECIGWRLEECV
jgi:hypothetical protein